MLLKEWWAWWAALKALHAQEMLDQRRVLVVADSGWTMDRETEIEQWLEASEGSTGWRSLEAAEPRSVARSARNAGAEVRGLFSWLRGKFWGDASQSLGFEEDRHTADGE